jgi:hypothetical protein
MKPCTGIMGRPCTCGLWHGEGGRLVDTERHEAPSQRHPFAPGVIEGPDSGLADFLKKDNALTALLRWAAGPALLVITAGCAVMAAINFLS